MIPVGTTTPALRRLSTRRLFGADPDADEGRHIEESRGRRLQGLSRRDRWVSLLLAFGFLVVSVGASLTLPSDRTPSVLLVVALVAAYTIASRVEFEVGSGSAVPTQLVLVPMLFLLPLGLVPFCVATGFLLADVPRYLRRQMHPERAAVLLASSWHSLGPVIVLGIAGERGPSWHDVPLYLAALAAQFSFDFASSGSRAAFAFGVPFRSQLPEMASVWAVDVALAPMGLFVAFESARTLYAFLGSLPLLFLTSVFARERRARIDNALELSSAYRGTALLLGDVVEADDEYTGAHSRDVVMLVEGVAARLGLDAREPRNAAFAALLHDVGKIRVPDEIINKTGPLDDEEWEIMKRHTVEGERMLKAVGGILGEVGEIVRSCHERWDGSGYPDGLAGEDIPLIARIVCACDAYSAITTNRSYRAARTPHEAIAELERCAGSHFDPKVVSLLAEIVHETEPASDEHLAAAREGQAGGGAVA
jgi:HD-GYP domain-containing protein (c-di-GMP phosphodiesterase class II)